MSVSPKAADYEGDRLRPSAPEPEESEVLDQQVIDAIVGSAAGSQRSLDHVSQRSLDHVSQRSLDHVSERSGSGSKLSVSELRVFNLYYFLEKKITFVLAKICQMKEALLKLCIRSFDCIGLTKRLKPRHTPSSPRHLALHTLTTNSI